MLPQVECFSRVHGKSVLGRSVFFLPLTEEDIDKACKQKARELL
jgi:hypothetical protein